MIGLIVLLAATGPNPETTMSGNIPRFGGVCLQLEQWRLFGWGVVGQSHTVDDATSGRWHLPEDDPPCADVPLQTYLIRTPLDAPSGVYRVCGLADGAECLEFGKIPFVSPRSITPAVTTQPNSIP